MLISTGVCNRMKKKLFQLVDGALILYWLLWAGIDRDTRKIEKTAKLQENLKKMDEILNGKVGIF